MLEAGQCVFSNHRPLYSLSYRSLPANPATLWQDFCGARKSSELVINATAGRLHNPQQGGQLIAARMAKLLPSFPHSHQPARYRRGDRKGHCPPSTGFRRTTLLESCVKHRDGFAAVGESMKAPDAPNTTTRPTPPPPPTPPACAVKGRHRIRPCARANSSI